MFELFDSHGYSHLDLEPTGSLSLRLGEEESEGARMVDQEQRIRARACRIRKERGPAAGTRRGPLGYGARINRDRG